mmetsp:Transcript_14116/g.28872  ORF Transcript_14116/g.28872 Transcript_14116/m.28872 type:complete len:110 (-) Transcript_14116:75-404(-)
MAFESFNNLVCDHICTALPSFDIVRGGSRFLLRTSSSRLVEYLIGILSSFPLFISVHFKSFRFAGCKINLTSLEKPFPTHDPFHPQCQPLNSPVLVRASVMLDVGCLSR